MRALTTTYLEGVGVAVSELGCLPQVHELARMLAVRLVLRLRLARECAHMLVESDVLRHQAHILSRACELRKRAVHV